MDDDYLLPASDRGLLAPITLMTTQRASAALRVAGACIALATEPGANLVEKVRSATPIFRPETFDSLVMESLQ